MEPTQPLGPGPGQQLYLNLAQPEGWPPRPGRALRTTNADLIPDAGHAQASDDHGLGSSICCARVGTASDTSEPLGLRGILTSVKLLILGGSGGIGQRLLQIGAQRGHDIVALLRPHATFDAPPSVTVVRGDATDPRVLAAIVPGKDAVLSSIGQRSASLSPWSITLSPHDIVEAVTRSLIPVMTEHGVRRLVFVSAGGVRDSLAKVTPVIRWMIARPRLKIAYADLARAEAIAAASSLDWLAVRPVTLRRGGVSGRLGPATRYTIFSSVSRADVAAWMLDAAERPRMFSERTVLLGRRD
jgi:putative NADH-flavin reductase